MGFIDYPSPILGNDPNDLPKQVEVDASGNLLTATSDGSNATLGEKADSAVTDPLLSASVVALLKGILSKTGEIDLTADTINLSTDDLETLLGDLKTLIGEVQVSPTANTLLARLKSLEDKIDGIIDGTTPAKTSLTGSLANGVTDALPVQLSGSILAEQKTQADAENNVITFAENITAIEIYHEEATWQDFIVNGITLKIPAGGYRTPVSGVASVEVTIPAGVDCLVGRLV